MKDVSLLLGIPICSSTIDDPLLLDLRSIRATVVFATTCLARPLLLWCYACYEEGWCLLWPLGEGSLLTVRGVFGFF